MLSDFSTTQHAKYCAPYSHPAIVPKTTPKATATPT